MKIFHLSDLHLGKRVNEFSMLEDQKDILIKIINAVDKEKPEAVVIAGDVYDRTVPSAEAVQLFDNFLVRLKERGIKVLCISGNHDSAERLAFGRELMDTAGVYMAPVYNGEIEPVALEDEHGQINFYLLPFIKPVHVRSKFPEENIESYTDAVRVAIEHMNVDAKARNVIVTHQFVTGGERSESEELSVGGSDNVDAEAFAVFDYVALGHLHGPQKISRETIRYCGTPLKYSFSEKDHKKSITVVDFGEKGEVTINTIPLTPKHDMREIRGTYDELMLKENYEGTDTEDYIHVIMTDENDVDNAMNRMRNVYPNIMALDYDNLRTKTSKAFEMAEEVEKKSELDLLAELYDDQNNQAMSEEQIKLAEEIFDELKEAMR